MKKSELKSLIKEIVQELEIPKKDRLPYDIQEFIARLEEVAHRRSMNGNDRVAMIAVVTHLLVKDSWHKGSPQLAKEENNGL